MPKTRTDIERHEKIDEIVAAARRQMLDGGYSALSVAGIARELGLAQNAIYWYFPTRDHLFVAAMRSLMARAASRKPPMTTGPFDRAVWIVDRFADIHHLIVAMHDRARVSAVVAEFEEELERLVRGMVVHALEPHVPEQDLEVAVESYLATVEGVLLRQPHPDLRSAVVRYSLTRLMGVSGEGAAVDGEKPRRRRLHARDLSNSD